MHARLTIDASSYRPSRRDGLAWTGLAGLPGGASGLLPGDRMLGPGALEGTRWGTDQVEALFLQLDHMSARPYLASQLQGRQAFAADIVLLRELAHHAKLREIGLGGSNAPG